MSAGTERLAVATFVAGLHRADAVADFYAAGLSRIRRRALARRHRGRGCDAARTQGPYGRYPDGPLSAEDTPGPAYRVISNATP